MNSKFNNLVLERLSEA